MGGERELLTGFGATYWGGFGMVFRPHADPTIARTSPITTSAAHRQRPRSRRATFAGAVPPPATRRARRGVQRQPLPEVRTEDLRELLPFALGEALERAVLGEALADGAPDDVVGLAERHALVTR